MAYEVVLKGFSQRNITANKTKFCYKKFHHVDHLGQKLKLGYNRQ